MDYCFEHDCFKVNHKGYMVCPKHEVATGNGRVVDGRRWQPSR